MTRWTKTNRKELADKQPIELRTLIAAALDAIGRALPLLAELTDSRQPGLPVTTIASLKAAGQQRSRELAARYPSRRADGSLIAVGQRGLVRSDSVVTMPGERPVPVNLSAVSVADEITTDLIALNRRIHRQLAAAGVCHIRRPLDHPDNAGQVLAETRRLVDVIASHALLLEVTRTVEELADRADTIALGPDRVPHPRPCPHCGRHSLVVHLDAGITRCEGTHRCKCTDSYCACQHNRAHRHEWLRSAPDKATRKGWRSRKESWDGLTREQDLVDREKAADDTDTTEGATTVTETPTIEVKRLEHCEEWCEQPAESPHDPTCPDHPMAGTGGDGQPYTKADFVEHVEIATREAIRMYRFWVEEEHVAPAEALEAALSEAEESAVCYAGIGSCGRGWCDHS